MMIMVIAMNSLTYFTILPSEIRYNTNLSSFEKILFSEILVLSSFSGYCFATNQYFAKMYNKHEKSISRSINKLKNQGLIKINYDDNKRKIYVNKGVTKMLLGGNKNVTRGGNKNVNYNKQDNNIKYNNSYYKKKKLKPVPEWYDEYENEKNDTNNYNKNKKQEKNKIDQLLITKLNELVKGMLK